MNNYQQIQTIKGIKQKKEDKDSDIWTEDTVAIKEEGGKKK